MSSSSSSSSSSALGKAVRWLLVLAALAGVGYVTWRSLASNEPTISPAQAARYTVAPGNMVVSFTEGGTLEAVEETLIRSEVEAQSRIVFLSAEGTTVKKGQLLVELDSSELRDRIYQQEITVQNASASENTAREALAIKKSQNETNIRDGEFKVDFAAVDLERFRDGDWPQTKRKAESDITIAEAELTRVQDRLAWTEKLEAQGYATRSELEADRLELKRKQLDLEQAQNQLKLLEKYEYPQRMKRLQAELDKQTEELSRVRRRGAAEMAQTESDLSSKSATLVLQQEKLNGLKEQLVKSKIYAPQSGLVVYATSAGGGRRGVATTALELGATVNFRQELIKLPDVSRMKLVVKVHEARIQQVKYQMPVLVSIDTIPDRHFKGVVNKIGVLPDAASNWMNPDLKVYSTEILIQDELPPQIKPGVSARGEIIVANLDNALSVPLQAVVSMKSRQYVFVPTATGGMEPRGVSVGLYNDKVVEVLDGLKAGDVVVLNPPSSSDALRDYVRFTTEEEAKAAGPAAEAARNAPPPEPPKPGDVAGGTELPAGFLDAMPEDKRAQFMERWNAKTDDEKRQTLEKMKQRGGGMGRRPEAAPGAATDGAAAGTTTGDSGLGGDGAAKETTTTDGGGDGG